MATYRAMCAFPMLGGLPRDNVTISPHFNGSDPAALAAALKTNFIANNAIADKPFTIKIYDALKPKPNYPLATVVNGTGSRPTTMAREMALCLSYYAQFNRKHSRGRFYIPATFLGGSLGLRPTAGQITAALDWKNIFTTGLPTGHKWNTYSPTTGASEPVSHVWVDDEWDVIRSRGLKGTTRQTAKVT